MNIEILMEQFCHYSKYILGYSKHTTDRYRQVIRFFVKHTQVNDLDDITESAINSYFIFGRTQRNWSPNTFISHHKTLLVFFRWCQKKQVLEHNYIENIELPKRKKKLPIRVSKDQAFNIMEIAYNLPYKYQFLKSRNHAIFATFIYAGLRKSELLNLNLTDVDIENLTIFVRQGKGGKDRMVPMSFALAQSLKRYLVDRKRLNKTCPNFFTSLNRNKGFTSSGLKRLIDKVKLVSGINFSSHKLRHTFATLMLEGGCDVISLSKMMGHSKIETTMIYTFVTTQLLRSQIAKHPMDYSTYQ